MVPWVFTSPLYVVIQALVRGFWVAVAERILHLRPLVDLRSDKSLVKAAQSGRSDAASALIERYYPRVHSFISYLTKPTKADDLTQEVFTKALGALNRFNGQYQFEPWLLKIARNLVIDEARRDLHRPAPADPHELVELEQVPEGEDRVWESLSRQLAGSLVRDALSRLPERQRTVLVLREIEGLSYKEISEIVGTNTRGVEATLRRARERFRLEATHGETLDALKSACKRTRKLVACEAKTEEATKHLRSCPECRRAAASIRSADKLFGSLPPLFLGKLTWTSQLASLVGPKQRPHRGILEILRGSPQSGLISPLAHILETTLSVAMAGVVSVSTVAGQTARLAVSAEAAPPAFEAQTFEALQASTLGAGQAESESAPRTSPSVTTMSANSSDMNGPDDSLLAGALDLDQLTVASATSLLDTTSLQIEDALFALDSATPGPTRQDRLPLSSQLPSPDISATTPPVSIPRRQKDSDLKGD